MLAAVKALVARAGDDLSSGWPNDSFRRWMEQGDRARLTLAAVDEESSEDATYVFLSLQALSKVDFGEAFAAAIHYLSRQSEPIRAAAAKAIGTFKLDALETRLEAVTALTSAIAIADDSSLGHILTAVCEIIRTHPELEALAVTLVQSAKPKAGDQSVYQLSLELMFHGEALPPSLLVELTGIMHNTDIGAHRTLNNIDTAASKLVMHGRLDEALALISPLIARHDELASLEKLKSFSHSLLQLRRDQLANVVTAWLLSLDPNLGHATMSLVGKHHGNEPLIIEIDQTSTELSDANKVLLSHRAIGYLFIYPIAAASLLLSLLKDTAETPRKVIAELLFDPLLINYSGQLADWLRERCMATSDPAVPIALALLARLETYIEGLRDAGRIRELDPSERERLIQSHRQLEAVRQVHKEAEKRSVFMSLVSRSVILYGTRSISYVSSGLDGERHRHEMKLHSFSHSYEAPRLDILEPFELDYTLRLFRVMRGMPE